MSIKINADFFEKLGYKFKYPVGIRTGIHESLYDVYTMSQSYWFYKIPNNMIKIKSEEHFLILIRSHKLKKLLNK